MSSQSDCSFLRTFPNEIIEPKETFTRPLQLVLVSNQCFNKLLYSLHSTETIRTGHPLGALLSFIGQDVSVRFFHKSTRE